MSEIDDIKADDILRRIFDIIVNEARANPALSKKLLAAFSKASIAKIEKAKSKHSSFDPGRYHAVNILRAHGENVLRGKLEQIRNKANLRAVARASSLLLQGDALKSKATAQDLIEAIISAAKHYDRERSIANV